MSVKLVYCCSHEPSWHVVGTKRKYSSDNDCKTNRPLCLQQTAVIEAARDPSCRAACAPLHSQRQASGTPPPALLTPAASLQKAPEAKSCPELLACVSLCLLNPFPSALPPEDRPWTADQLTQKDGPMASTRGHTHPCPAGDPVAAGHPSAHQAALAQAVPWLEVATPSHSTLSLSARLWSPPL